METLIATAFGRYVNLQRGEADKLAEDARILVSSGRENQVLSPEATLALICKFYLTGMGSRISRGGSAELL